MKPTTPPPDFEPAQIELVLRILAVIRKGSSNRAFTYEQNLAAAHTLIDLAAADMKKKLKEAK
jgi:hypothetical protein